MHSGAYERAIAAADPFVTVVGVACPELVPLIERGSPFDEQIVDAVRHYTRPLREAEVDTVILGCTHYPLIAPDAPAHARPRRGDRQLRRAASPARSSTCSAAAGWATRAPARATTASSRPATPRRCAPPAPASCSSRSARSSTSRCVDGVRRGAAMTHDADTQRRPRRRRAAAGDDRARLRAHRDRLGADLLRRHARDLHGVGAGVRPALDGRPGPRLDDRRVRDAPRVDGRAQAARRHQGPAGRPHASRSSG